MIYIRYFQMVTNYKYNVFLSALQHLLDGVKNNAMCKGKECELQHCNMRMDK